VKPGGAALRSLRPEVASLWVRQAFRAWPGRHGRWIDLGDGRLGRAGDASSPLPREEEVGTVEGLLYVPPVDDRQRAARDALVAGLGRRQLPLLVQVVAGADAAAATAPGVEVLVVDLLEALLERRLDALEAVPAGAVALWPLVTGLTDDEDLWSRGCARLASAGVACAQAVAPDLAPAERRELAGGVEEGEAFSRLFHGRAASERRFAAVAAGHGLAPFFRRPGRRAERRSRNQALAELLALAGEVWLRLGRPDVGGQDLFRASRWVEETAVDVRALARESNREIVDQLRGPAAAIVDEWARSEVSPTVDAWLAEYVTAP
jgi:hypothetical protein